MQAGRASPYDTDYQPALSVCVQKMVSPGVYAVCRIHPDTAENTAVHSTEDFGKEHTRYNSYSA